MKNRTQNLLEIGALICLLALLVWIAMTEPAQATAPLEKQAPRVCGSETMGMHYVSSYVLEDGFVIDMVYGGIWPEQECTVHKDLAVK